jgi:hypothetical protein
MQKNILSLCILTASALAHSGFDPVGDDALSNISGQSGITIDADLYATIGSVEYTDEGSIGINNIVIGGANKQTYFGIDWGPGSHSGNKLDGSLLTIDVLPDGDLVIAGGVDPSVGGIIDFGITTGSIQLHSADKQVTATLIDSISLSGVTTKFRMKIDAATSHIFTEMDIGISDLDIDISSLNMKIEDVFVASSNYLESKKEWGQQGVSLSDIVAAIKIDVHADADGLHIDPQSLVFDMGIGAISIAEAPVGSFYLDNVDFSNMSVVISGHQ